MVTQRNPPRLQTPDILSTDVQMQAWGFPDRGPAGSPPRSPYPTAQENPSGKEITGVVTGLQVSLEFSLCRTELGQVQSSLGAAFPEAQVTLQSLIAEQGAHLLVGTGMYLS